MLDNKKIEEIKNKLIEKFEECETLSYFLDENSCNDIEESTLYYNILEYLNKKGENYEVFTGATKVAFLFNDIENIIIKIPFDGYCSTEYDEIEDWSEEEQEEGFKDVYFDTNYCGEEADLYAIMEGKELEDFFAETRFVAEINGRKFYAQEYVPVTQLNVDDAIYYEDDIIKIPNSVTTKPQEETLKKSKEIQSKVNPYTLNDYWFAKAVEYYGEEKSEKLLTFLYDYNINDLHNSNIGYRSNGSPCIFDFSGYEE
jgi:hypothetical protein